MLRQPCKSLARRVADVRLDRLGVRLDVRLFRLFVGVEGFVEDVRAGGLMKLLKSDFCSDCDQVEEEPEEKEEEEEEAEAEAEAEVLEETGAEAETEVGESIFRQRMCFSCLSLASFS